MVKSAGTVCGQRVAGGGGWIAPKKCQVRYENSVRKKTRCTHAATHITSEQRRTPLIIIEWRLQNQTRRRRKSSGKEGNLTDIFTTVKKNKKNYLHLRLIW